MNGSRDATDATPSLASIHHSPSVGRLRRRGASSAPGQRHARRRGVRRRRRAAPLRAGPVLLLGNRTAALCSERRRLVPGRGLFRPRLRRGLVRVHRLPRHAHRARVPRRPPGRLGVDQRPDHPLLRAHPRLRDRGRLLGQLRFRFDFQSRGLPHRSWHPTQLRDRSARSGRDSIRRVCASHPSPRYPKPGVHLARPLRGPSPSAAAR